MVVGSGGSGGSGGVDDVVANGPQGVLKQYFPLGWLNRPMLSGFSCGGGGGGGDGGGDGGGSGCNEGGGGGGESGVDD